MFVGLAIGRPRLRRTPRPSDASHAIPPCVLRFEASRHARILSPSCWAFGLGFEAQTKKPSTDGFVGKPPNPTCSARPPAKPLDLTATVHRDMNPLGFVPDLSMRGVGDNSIGGDNVHGPTTAFPRMRLSNQKLNKP
jgi:hypothetical protein